MGNKIITEKDFWMCTGGNVPAQLQSTQLSTKKKDGKKYITLVDTATSSMMDFGCNKLMLIMAIVAAVIAVCVVATGGAALIVIGALAGAAGAAVGAVMGGLICGQVAAMARMWLASKNNLKIQGKPAITGDHQMQCMLFGDTITFAPNIKNWWQAITVGAINTTAKIVEGALFGMLVGMGAGVLKGLTQLAMPTATSIGVNIIGSFGTLGSSVRAVFGIQNATRTWAMGDDLLSLETGNAFFDGAIPEYESIKRIAKDNAKPQDAMLLLYLLHIKDPTKAPSEEPTKIEEEPVKNNNIAEPEPVKQKGDGEAFEASPKPKNSPDVAKWEAKGGKVEVNGDTWKYTDWEGNVVEYKNGYPDFEPYSRQSVDIGKQEGNYSSDFKNAENKSNEIPPKLGKDETVWHHHEDGKTMQEVDRTIHDRFTHRGGVSESKKVSLGKK